MSHMIAKLLLVCALVFATSVYAQDEADDFQARVAAVEGVVRSAPSYDAEVIASVFENEALGVVGRNLDGTWFEVIRPGRMTSLGWLSASLLDLQFEPEDLPLTNLTAGSSGEHTLDADPGAAGYLTIGAWILRLPIDGEEVYGAVPFGAVVPVLARNRDGSWVSVHYLGIEGWIFASSIRLSVDVETLPIAPGLPDVASSFVPIIPLDVQLGEIQALRDYIYEQREFTAELEGFWSTVYNGDQMPCEPPPFVTTYIYSEQNERAFPELDWLVPRLSESVDLINASIEPMYMCGIKRVALVLDARNAAINARLIFDATLDAIDGVEDLVMRDR